MKLFAAIPAALVIMAFSAYQACAIDVNVPGAAAVHAGGGIDVNAPGAAVRVEKAPAARPA